MRGHRPLQRLDLLVNGLAAEWCQIGATAARNSSPEEHKLMSTMMGVSNQLILCELQDN
jgi:hypothetical protein